MKKLLPPPEPPSRLRPGYEGGPPPDGFDARTFWKVLGFLVGVILVALVWSLVMTWFVCTFDWGIVVVLAMFIGPLLVAFAAAEAGWEPPLP